jgi:hypothetical protein
VAVVAIGLSVPVAYAWLAEQFRLAVVEYAPAAGTALVTGGIVWRTIVLPAALFLAPIFLVMWAACAAFGVALTRIASGEVSES